MKVLNIGLDNSVLDKSSPAGERASWYAKLTDKYTIIAPDRNVGKISAFCKIYRQGRKILSNEKYDVITIQDQYYLALLGWVLAKKFKVCFHLQIHGFEKFYGLRKLIAKFVIPRADAVRCVSRRLKKQLINDFNVKEEKISVVPIYIDIKKILELPVKTDLCEKYPQFDFIILMASRFSQVKNIPLAIGAMRDVIKEYSKTGLVIVGDGTEKSNLKNQISKSGLGGNIIIEEWTDDLISYYKTADLFLLTSNYEGYGRTLIEAAAAGCNIISSDVGIADEILDKENIFEVNNKEQLKEKIIKAIKGEIKMLDLGGLTKMPSKEEYLQAYKKSWENCL